MRISDWSSDVCSSDLPEEDDSSEHRTDPLDPVEVELVAEPVHDHVAGGHDGNAEQQAPPKPTSEHLHVVAGVGPVIRRCVRRVIHVAPPESDTPLGYQRDRKSTRLNSSH